MPKDVNVLHDVKLLRISPDATYVTMKDDSVLKFLPANIQIEMDNGDMLGIDQVMDFCMPSDSILTLATEEGGE